MRERCTKVKCQGEDTHTHRLENKVHRVSKRKRQTDRQMQRESKATTQAGTEAGSPSTG